ncbi:unnamed protein product [Trifolium pratense]|uniref:Uncharacterized protein n=1 Tax=Trifolium pratense TaxID=57577 RepID=A0ACB0MAF9_TRIPR|nr:unnamed protein product [Trifolium pratense]
MICYLFFGVAGEDMILIWSSLSNPCKLLNDLLVYSEQCIIVQYDFTSHYQGFGRKVNGQLLNLRGICVPCNSDQRIGLEDYATIISLFLVFSTAICHVVILLYMSGVHRVTWIWFISQVSFLKLCNMLIFMSEVKKLEMSTSAIHFSVCGVAS